MFGRLLDCIQSLGTCIRHLGNVLDQEMGLVARPLRFIIDILGLREPFIKGVFLILDGLNTFKWF